MASLAGCNFVKSVFLGPSITTKKVPNAVRGKPYDTKMEVSGATFTVSKAHSFSKTYTRILDSNPWFAE
jgi:hypothetical protein